jgi:MoaA/NifB/PqqE/SkfB family radical SAM enzyme
VDDAPYVVKGRPGPPACSHDRAPLLSQLDIELTERCNLDCIHCYINQPAGDLERKNREMSTGQVKTILHEAAGLGCLTIRYTGGEPLLRKDFEELYLYARRLGLKVLLFTNATLITPRIADLLARVPPLERVEVTVYGMSPESYGAATGVREAYEAARRGMRLLEKRGVPFVVKSALLPRNAAERAAFEAWAASLPAMEAPPDYARFFDLRARRDSEAKNDRIRGLRTAPIEAFMDAERGSQAFKSEMASFCARFIGPPGERLFSCGAGHGACVDAYGRAQMCILLRHPETVYDLIWDPDPRAGGGCPSVDGTARSLLDALTRFFPRVRETRAANPDYLARCARCFLKGLCEQCPGKSWEEHGTLDTPVAYLCEVAHMVARGLGLLKADEKAWEVEDWKERIASIGNPEDG